MRRELPLPVRPTLNTLLAHRGTPTAVRRPLASAVVTAIRLHPARTWEKYMSWALLRTTDPPHPQERRKRGTMMADTGGRVIDEKDLPPDHDARRASPLDGRDPLSPEEQELLERRIARARHQQDARTRWLETSGFGAVIERAEALLADLDRAMTEHQAAQATLGDLATFIELASEAPEDAMLQRFARRAQDLAQQIARPPILFENATALRALIAKVQAADLEGVNGARNTNLTAAWMRQFRELVSPLPQPGHAQRCEQQVKAFLAEARAARVTGER